MLQFTLWPSARRNEGAHTEITWKSFLDFLSRPVVAASKDGLEGWSPARFAGNRRAKANVEAVSCIVLDDDRSKLPIERVVALYSGVAGAVHSSFSHAPEHPKWRIVLACSRDMTADEQARVWRWARDRYAHPLDESTRDPSRLWYVPAHREGAAYQWVELEGTPLPVDKILAAVPSEPAPAPVPAAPRVAPAAPPGDGELTYSERAAAASLAAVWPAMGNRHLAKLALGGALKRDGWSEDRALAFARELYRHVPDGANLEADIRDNWRRDVTEQTGWSRLAELTRAPDVVSSVRELLGGGASLKARLAEVAERRDATAPAGSRYKPPADRTVSCGGIAFRVGQLEAKLPPLVYQVDGIFCKGDVIMLVAHGNSLKTWIAFSLALAVATGKPWLGKFPAVRGRVAVLDYESGDYEVVRRLQLLGAKDAEVGDRLLRASYSDAQLTDPETWIELAKLGLDLLVIDSFKAASPDVDENDARSARLLELAGQFADATGCTVLVIHHSRKGSGGDAREKVRGSTALFAACDRIFEFTEPDKKDGGIVETTMQPVKDGAGRRAGDVRVELSDQGLRWIEIPNEAPAEDNPKTMTLEKCKARALEILREAHRQGRMSGIPRRQLRNMLRGPNTLRDEAIESLELAGYTRAYTERVGRARTEFVMLHPHAERP